jgi:RNA polymerase sigma-70 factor (ECF subfamily)
MIESPPLRAASWDKTAKLVERAQGGDREAFGLLIEQFQRTVYAICLGRLGQAGEAAELTQEVFLHVMNRLDQLREPERFAGWLRQVAARMAINRATRRVPPAPVEHGVLESIGASHDNPLDTLIRHERAARLWEGLARLKPLDRDTLVAFYIHGHTLIEMAERHDAPIGTIKRRLHTARLRLKAELQNSSADEDEWYDELPDSADEPELAEVG